MASLATSVLRTARRLPTAIVAAPATATAVRSRTCDDAPNRTGLTACGLNQPPHGPCGPYAVATAKRIKVENPVVDLDGDEMTRIIWQMIKDKVRGLGAARRWEHVSSLPHHTSLRGSSVA